jgi:hypothetical protein
VSSITLETLSSHIPKFAKSYFNLWKHTLMLIFKTKKLWLLVDKKEVKPIALSPTQIIVKTPLLPLIGARNISAWENRDALVLAINKICLNNNVI